MSDAFHSRLADANEFTDNLIQKMQAMGFVVAKNGTEHTHPQFVDELRRSLDQTSLAIRFQPDCVSCIGKIPRSFYVEAKFSDSIEKLAWQQYNKLSTAGNIVVIVFGKLSWRWNFIQHIDLIHGAQTVSDFPPKNRFPVDKDGWICPRDSANWMKKLRQHNKQASGTTYRNVDPVSLHAWQDFKTEVIAALIAQQQPRPALQQRHQPRFQNLDKQQKLF